MCWCNYLYDLQIDYYWTKLGEGGDETKQRCGWLEDKFGVTWQVVPEMLGDMRESQEREKVDAMLQAMLQMKKLDIAAMKQAFEAGGE